MNIFPKVETSTLVSGLLTILLMLFSSCLFSQQSLSDDPAIRVYNFPAPLDNVDFPFSIVTLDESTPNWARNMYLPDPDMELVFQQYEIWRKANPSVKNNHVRNFRKLKGYLFLNDALDETGRIKPKENNELKTLSDLMNKKRAKTSESSLKGSNNTSWMHQGPTFKKTTDGDLVNRHINIYSITQCLSNTDILYCTSESGATIYKSINNGDSWFSVSDDYIIDMGPRNIEVAPTDPDRVYLCAKHDIYKTDDGGLTWASVYNSSNVNNLTLIIHPTNPDIVWAGGKNGVIMTMNGGTNWTTVLTVPNVYDLRFQPGSNQVIYALVDNTSSFQTDFYKSIDGGVTWTKKENGWPDEPSNSNLGGQMTTSDQNPNVIFAFIGATWTDANNQHNVKILKSTDAGESWQLKVDYNNVKGINSGQGYYDWDIEMSDADSDIVAFGTQSSWISYDGLETVTASMRDGWSGHADIQEMLFNGNEIWVVNDGGVTKYENDSLYNFEVKSVGIDAISYWGYDHGWNKDAWCGVHYHNGTSASSESYEDSVAINFGGAEPHFALVSYPNADKIVSKGYGSVNGYNLPENQNGSFDRFSYNLTPNADYIYGNNVAIDLYAYDTHYLGYENQVMKSTNFGVSWDPLSTLTANIDDKVWDIKLTRDNPDVMYASTFRSGAGKVFRSTDRGVNFQELSLPANFNNRPKVMWVEVADDDQDEIYVMGERSGIHISKSEDGGQSWTDLWTNTLSGYVGREILHVSGTDGGIYLVTSTGIFYRNNSMNDWELLMTGIPLNTSYRFIQAFYRDSELRIATSRGVYAAKLFNSPVLSEVLLQPAVQNTATSCIRDTFFFDDYSVVDHSGAVWDWSFPGATYVSAANVRDPKVLYSQDGTYDVTMSITKAGQTYSKTITDMITVSDQCAVIDSLPDQALYFGSNNEHVVTEDFNLVTNTFSFTGWIKPESSLVAFSGIFSNGVWCAHCNDQTLGLEINYWGGHLWYRWPGSTSGWASNTSLAPLVDEWNFVAMVMSPDSVVVYLNDEKWVSEISHDPADISELYIAKGFYDKYFQGEVEEYTFWKKSLDEQEVRELMHMIKDPSDHPDLVTYYQFNEDGNDIFDKASSNHATMLNGTSRTTSSAPVGQGYSSTQIETTGQLIYDDEGMTLDIDTHANADLVISRINSSPFAAPIGYDAVFSKQYWTVHRYGAGNVTGKTIVKLSENLSYYDATSPEFFALLGRSAHGHEAWTLIDTSSMVDYVTDQVTFDTIATYAQLLVVRTDHFICDSNIVYENTNSLPDLTGSSSYIKAGNLSGEGDVEILPEQNIIFVSEDYIELLPGFIVNQGGLFQAIIDTCPD